MESTELGRRVCGFRSSQAGLLFIKCLYRRRYIILAMAAALPVMLFIFGTLKFVMSDADLLMFFNIYEQRHLRRGDGDGCFGAVRRLYKRVFPYPAIFKRKRLLVCPV